MAERNRSSFFPTSYVPVFSSANPHNREGGALVSCPIKFLRSGLNFVEILNRFTHYPFVAWPAFTFHVATFPRCAGYRMFVTDWAFTDSGPSGI